MKIFSPLALVVTLLSTNWLSAHCQVPCGVYGDSARFTQMLEDQTTIAKAIAQINDLADKKDGKSANQLARWVSTKEDHANKIQKIIAEYFLTQRIKSSSDKYEDLLKGAHSVMVAAMKCKQGTDPESAEALKSSIEKFQAVYEK
jgi:nickel superoxide dismutase